jgi:hypothetical protein
VDDVRPASRRRRGGYAAGWKGAKLHPDPGRAACLAEARGGLAFFESLIV